MNEAATDSGPMIERPLGHYRVLEMQGAAPLMAGKTFADLGADVIKVEPPGGDPARRILPLIELSGHEPVGTTWAALDIGKRHVIADLATPEGLAAVKSLASEADVLIEAFMPGEMERLLSRDELRKANPRLVITSLSHFGQTGPYSGWYGSDLVNFAMSCYLHMTGPADGPPIKPSVPFQTYYHAAMQAVVGTLIALRQREITGRGTDVDHASREVGLWMLTHTYQYWDMQRRNLRRLGSSRDMGAFRRLRMIYACKDGQLVWMASTGHIGGASLKALVDWMQSESMAPEWLQHIDWLEFDYAQQGPEMVDRLERAFQAFFLTKTKAEMLDWSLAHRLMMATVQDLNDVLADPQLETRSSWRSYHLPGSAKTVRIPGSPVRLSGALWEPRVDVHEDASPGWKPGRGATSPSVPLRLAEREAQRFGVHNRDNGAPHLPLEGIRIIDFSTTLAGPMASRHFADYGAEVIRVESNAHPDTLRVGTPFVDNKPGVNRSAYFGAYNAGKKSIALNMQKPESREIVKRLLQKADILLEAYVPGVMERWGLAWKDVHPLNPRLIMASHCLQGQWGPRASHRGYGQIAAAMTGWYSLTGLPGYEPMGPYSAYTDFVCWPFLATSLLVALEVRDQTGVGQYIDHAHVDTSIHFLAPQLLDLQLNRRLGERRGNWDDYASPNNAYQCAGDDRWLALTVTSDAQWQRACEVFGHSDAATDSRFATHAARKANETQLDALISTWTRDRTDMELAQALQVAGIAAGPVERASDLFEDPQLARRRFFRRLQHSELGDHAVLTPTFRIGGLEQGPFSAAPLLGEHTHQICSEVVGMSEEEIAQYASLGVFE